MLEEKEFNVLSHCDTSFTIKIMYLEGCNYEFGYLWTTNHLQ